MNEIYCNECEYCLAFRQVGRDVVWRCGYEADKPYNKMPVVYFGEPSRIFLKAPDWCPKRNPKPFDFEYGDRVYIEQIVNYFKGVLQEQNPDWKMLDIFEFVEGLEKGIYSQEKGIGFFVDLEGSRTIPIHFDVSWISKNRYKNYFVAWREYERKE